MNQETYIQERVIDQINWYSKKSSWNKKMFYFFSIGSIALSSMIPILSLVSNAMEENTIFVNIGIALVGAIISVFSGVIFICKFNDHWIEYRRTSETMRHELSLFETGSGSYESKKSFKGFVLKIETLISKENSNWCEISSDDED